MAQLNFLVGDIEGNAEKIIANSIYAKEKLNADLVVFPELCLTGYPPEDLLLRPGLYLRIKNALKKILENTQKICLIIGYPSQTTDGVYNAASLIEDGQIICTHYKECLPNYSVFDEKRYFKTGCSPTVTTLKGIPIAITICEDLWLPEPIMQASKAGALLAISLNASPFDRNKPLQRQELMGKRAKESGLPIVYVNMVGGQDELVFDGGSMVINQDGETCLSAGYFEEKLEPITLEIFDNEVKVPKSKLLPIPHEEERVYKALVLGVRDYIEKNNFPGAIISLSGGIDSALTLAIAVDAIGSERIEAVLMPSRFTSELSNNLAKQQAEKMKVNYRIISIEPVFSSFLKVLEPEFQGFHQDVTEENLQARCRGTILMALSNKFGKIVLSTGNKSELSVGYATLYGDMVGGFCVLKDVPKTLVYRLVEYRNKISPVIPQEVINRPPTAELAENQKDQDLLPPYPILDAILEKFIEKDQSYFQIVEAGFDPETVKRVIKMIDKNEYKRRQSPLGVKITVRAFGRDRRYPITSGYAQFLDSKIG